MTAFVLIIMLIFGLTKGTNIKVQRTDAGEMKSIFKKIGMCACYFTITIRFFFIVIKKGTICLCDGNNIFIWKCFKIVAVNETTNELYVMTKNGYIHIATKKN